MKRGIVETRTGFRASVRVGARLLQRRFPPGTSLRTMQDWRAAARTDALRESPPVDHGTFAADVQTYLAAVSTMPTYKDRAYKMRSWVAFFGTRPRDTITPADVRTALNTLRQRMSPSSCNRYRTALMHCYTVLNGKSGRNPARDVPQFREPAPEPRGYSYAIIDAVLALVRPSRSRARLKVLAYTGLSPASVKRIQPSDVQGAVLFRRRREKGHGTRPKSVPLLPQAVDAFAEMAAQGAWGDFTTRTLGGVWERAVDRFLAQQREADPTFHLPRYSLKDLRHSFGTRAYAVTHDLRVVGELLDHSTLDLTKRYTLQAVDDRLADAVAQMQASFMLPPKLPPPRKPKHRR